MKISGLQKLTLIDYPDKLACTVFLSGCNFRCGFCYSPELVLPDKINDQPILSEKEFFDFLKERKELLDGLVICGGEPTINKDLPEFISKAKKLGYLVKLDTNGSHPEMLEKLIEKKLVDYFAMDVKNLLKKENYQKTVKVKVNLNQIKKSINLIKQSGIDYEFRTTIVPGVHTKQDIIQLAQEISPADKFFLQNFVPEKTLEPEFEKIKPYYLDELIEIKEKIACFFKICQIRG